MSVAKRLIDQIQSRNRSRKRQNLLNNLPFEISMQSISDVDSWVRGQDQVRVKEFNDAVVAWTIHVTRRLKTNVRAMVRNDNKLSDSINPNVYYDKRFGKEVNRIGFSFAREGIYIHKGAGKGQGGMHGSTWRDIYGVEKKTLSSSLMKQGSGNRKPVEWFDPIIEQELPKLAAIVANYSSTLQMDATRIYIN